MSIGQMNKRVTIRQRSASFDAIGQPVDSWTDLVTLWADVRFLNGTESIKADKEVNAVKASCRIRRRTDITESMRVVYAGDTYNITAILPQDLVMTDLVLERV